MEGLKGWCGNQLSVLKNGLVLSFCLVLIFYLLNWFWKLVLSLGPNHFLADWANFALKITVFIIVAYFLSLAMEVSLVKRVLVGCLRRVPIIGALAESVEHFDRIKKEGAPEVIFEINPGSGVWIKGWVSKEFQDKKTGKVMCSVVLPMFVHPIGAYVYVEKARLVFTGKQAPETITECLSGGLIGKE